MLAAAKHMMRPKWLVGASYALGEERRTYREVEDCEGMFACRSLPFVPDVLGLESFHRTRDAYNLAAKSVARTLNSSGTKGSEIDAVVVCASQFRSAFVEQNRGIAAVLGSNGVAPGAIHAVCGSGCVALLSAVHLASQIIEAHGAERVLVVNIDQVEGGGDWERFVGYAMLSDSAASVVVSAAPGIQGSHHRVVCTCIRSDVDEMAKGIRAGAPVLGVSVLDSLEEKTACKRSEAHKVFSNNTFLPYKVSKERALGFTREQMFTSNVRRTGHCLAADTLINLVDHTQQHPGVPQRYVLYSEADGHAGAMLMTAD